MEITHSKIFLLYQGMLGCITPNIRYITVKYGNEYIFLYFYYQNQPSKEEEELAEEIASEVVLFSGYRIDII